MSDTHVPTRIRLDDGVFSHEHTARTSHITNVIVGDHHVVAGDGSAGQYVVWCIRVVIDDASHSSVVLYKRYSDLERLRQKLVETFPNEEIATLPPKDSLSVSRLWALQSWWEHRRKGLQWFLTNVLLNPKFQHSRVITDFVLS